MPFDNTRRFKLLALSAIAAACACAAPAIRAQVPSAPQAPAMAPTVAPTAPQAPTRNAPGMDAGKAKAPAAVGSGAAPDGLTLKQLEKIEREMAISKAKKALRDQTRADERPDDAGLPTGIPGAAGGPGAPRMIVMPDGRRVFQAPGGPFGASGPGTYGLATTPEQQLSEFKVLSVVSFRGSTSADIIDGSSLVKTIKVGDRVGPGTVASITSDGSVSVGVPSSAMPASTTPVTVKRDAKRPATRHQPSLGPGKYAQQGLNGAGGMMRYVTLARATDRVSGNASSQFGGAQQPPRLEVSQPINHGFMADATSVPMVGAMRPSGLGAPQFGPQGAPPAMGGGTFAVPVSPPGAFPPPAN